MNTMYLWHIHHTFRTTHLLSDVGEAVDKLDVAVKQIKIVIVREDVRNLILGYPSLKNKNFGTFLGEIHRINPEILGYPRIPGYPLTPSLTVSIVKIYKKCVFTKIFA